MAAEVDGLQHAAERCNLLVRVKSTVEGLLASGSTNVWSTYGGLLRISDDLERVLRHGLRTQQGLFGDQSDYTIFIKGLRVLRHASASTTSSLQKSLTEQEPENKGRAWLKKSLLDHCLSLYLHKLVSNTQHLEECYYEYAFLRSHLHWQALCTCLQAIERSNPSLLTEVNQVLLNKTQYIKAWLRNNDQPKLSHAPLEPATDKSSTDCENELLTADNINIVYSDSGGSERDDSHSMVSHNSLRALHVDLRNSLEENDGISSGSEHSGINSDNNIIEDNCLGSSPPQIIGSELIKNKQMLLARERLWLPGLKLVEPKNRKRKINQATLAQAALSVVLEKDERSPSPGKWFEGDGFARPRRSNSLNENDFRSSSILSEDSNRDSKASTLPTAKSMGMSSGSEVNYRICKDGENKRVTDFKAKKAIGHNRSKSDQIGVRKSNKEVIIKEPPQERERINSGHIVADYQSMSRLSSSLPASSAYFYYNDPLYANHEQQSLASMLASQDLSSCEMDKENAHFSISEALIEAIEQMKCDEVVASEDDDDDDDEEIQHLKQEIERRRQEKKQEKLRMQPAFSDGTSKSKGKSNSTGPSSTSTSSKSSLLESESDLSTEWEEVPRTDFPGLSHLSASETTLVPETDISAISLTVESIEASTSPPLSAEAVAKNLLKKFANKKHPAASELQWLVSEQDVPQSLLPLPQTFAVAPDDVISDQEDVARTSQLYRRASVPCRIRGNLQWAPPRPQIIFHVHPAPKRKILMEEQSYRCAGCGMRVHPDYMKRFRYCNYLGKYFCSSCHHNTLMAIPARIIRKWDFRKYEVSKFAKDLLNNIYMDPLFNIKDLSSSLYQRVRTLDEIRNLRKQLYFFRTFAETCRKSQELQQEFVKIPNHIFSDEHLFSIQDLFQVKSGDMVLFFRGLVTRCYKHIEQCPLCLAKGFICEYCKDGEDIIFPFELHKAIQCTECRASFHKDCYVKGKCPKCERIRIRKKMIAEPSPPEDETESTGEDLQKSVDVDLR